MPWRDYVPALLLAFTLLVAGAFVVRRIGVETTTVSPSPLPTPSVVAPDDASESEGSTTQTSVTDEPPATPDPDPEPVAEDLAESDLEAGLMKLLSESPIVFDANTATIRSTSEPTLDGVAELLARFPDVEVEVAGHTDTRGGEQLNAALSLNRAAEIVAALRERGVSSVLRARGYGATEPLVFPEATLADQEANRRIEFNVLP